MASCQKDILLNEYRTDVSCYAFNWFQEHKISEKKLRHWQEKYNLIYPWLPSYNEIRLSYNRLVQYFPLFIARVKSHKNIQWVLEFCRRYDVPFSIRSGAHDWLGFSSSTGVIIDMSKYDAVKIVNQKKGIVEVQAGARIGEVVKAISKEGLAIPAGTCQNVGITGLTLGGGLGFLTRKYGFTLDNLLEVGIILADGSYLRANKYHCGDLFWAIRGGGNGNFGIVTDLIFKAQHIKYVTLFELWFDEEKIVPALELWQDWSVRVDERIASEADLIQDKNNPGPLLITGQAELHPKVVKEKLQPFLHLHPKIKVWISSYADSVRHHATPLNKTNWYFHQNSSFLDCKLPSLALVIIKDIFKKANNKGLKLEIVALGGQVDRVKSNETAFPWRQSLYWLHLQSGWRDPSEERQLIAWNEELFTSLQPYLVNPKTGVIRAYVNFRSLHLKDKYPLGYWGHNYSRLQHIKKKYDPHNIFTFPQSIKLP